MRSAVVGPQCEQPIFLGAHGARRSRGWSARRRRRRPRAPARRCRRRRCCLTKFDVRARTGRAAVRSPCAACLTFSTWTGLSLVSLRQLVDIGQDVGGRGLVLGQEFRRRGQQIAARGAFGAADLQQQGGDLVFDLDGVHHQAAVLARLVDEQDRGCADRQPAPKIPPQAAGSGHTARRRWHQASQ